MNVVFVNVKYSLAILSLFFFMVGSVLAEEGDNSFASRIQRVDHDNKQLWVNDRLYIMPITLKVYTFNRKTRTKTKANRYALRVGLQISLKKTIRNRQAFVDEVIIYP
jgi:hypothetical protein